MLKNVLSMGLETIYKNILYKNDKVINIFDRFFIFPIKMVLKTFIIWFINNCPKNIY